MTFFRSRPGPLCVPPQPAVCGKGRGAGWYAGCCGCLHEGEGGQAAAGAPACAGRARRGAKGRHGAPGHFAGAAPPIPHPTPTPPPIPAHIAAAPEARHRLGYVWPRPPPPRLCPRRPAGPGLRTYVWSRHIDAVIAAGGS